MTPQRRSTDIDPLVKGRTDLEAARAQIRAVEARRAAENEPATRPLTFAAWLDGGS